MLFNNIFAALVLTCVVIAGPANMLVARDTVSVVWDPSCPTCPTTFTTGLCTPVSNYTGSCTVETPGGSVTLFQGAGCTGTGVTITQGEGAVHVDIAQNSLQSTQKSTGRTTVYYPNILLESFAIKDCQAMLTRWAKSNALKNECVNQMIDAITAPLLKPDSQLRQYKAMENIGEESI
ncbi:hypothetical protein C8J56DRAFT_891512 [Mycena floridula]|nr:hypothetical protein C8J56DRAFT_891512 [Mycena floridula]